MMLHQALMMLAVGVAASQALECFSCIGQYPETGKEAHLQGRAKELGINQTCVPNDIMQYRSFHAITHHLVEKFTVNCTEGDRQCATLYDGHDVFRFCSQNPSAQNSQFGSVLSGLRLNATDACAKVDGNVTICACAQDLCNGAERVIAANVINIALVLVVGSFLANH